MTYKAPPVSALADLCGLFKLADPEGSASRLRALLKGRLNPADPTHFPRTFDWMRRCYHEPRRHELVMSAANELLQGHGVELITARSGDWIEYVNAGDTYAATLMYVPCYGFRISDYGTWVERHPCD